MATRKRIILLHAYAHSMPAIVEAFDASWPEAEVLNLLDESLYADVSEDGTPSASISARLVALFRHCERSGAQGVLFTGSTFGPAVEAARAEVSIPILKSDEAVAERAVRQGGCILLLCTAHRALPVILDNIRRAAKAIGTNPEIHSLVVPGAKRAITGGDLQAHDRLIVEATAAAGNADIIVYGQYSMAAARKELPAALAERVLTGPGAAAVKMRELIEGA